jgi:hypothetical protein
MNVDPSDILNQIPSKDVVLNLCPFQEEMMEKTIAVEFQNQLMVAGDAVGIAEPLKQEIQSLAIELDMNLEQISLEGLRELAEAYLHKIINETSNI